MTQNRGSRKILARSRNLGNVSTESRRLIFYLFGSEIARVTGSDFQTRVLVSWRVSDFTIRLPWCWNEAVTWCVAVLLRHFRQWTFKWGIWYQVTNVIRVVVVGGGQGWGGGVGEVRWSTIWYLFHVQTFMCSCPTQSLRGYSLINISLLRMWPWWMMKNHKPGKNFVALVACLVSELHLIACSIFIHPCLWSRHYPFCSYLWDPRSSQNIVTAPLLKLSNTVFQN